MGRTATTAVEEGVVTRYEQATMAAVQQALSDEICRVGARLDQLHAARRDALTPCANIPITIEESTHDH